MTPGARVAAAIALVDRWLAGSEGIDRLLAEWGRGARYAGSGDRRAVADLVYDAVRRLRSALWVAGAPDLADEPAGGADPADVTKPQARAALIGSLHLDGVDPALLFTGSRHAPAPLAATEGAVRALEQAPQAVRCDVLDWLMAEPYLGTLPEAALLPLRQRAPLHLRVNRLKGDVPGALAALAEAGIVAAAGPLSPTCLRVVEGGRRLASSRAYREGLVEVQDAASQAVADLAAARPGETVLDLCAGGGGKALALAAAMGARGRLVAHDISADRLAQLGPRAERAGAPVEMRRPGALGSLAGACDLVLVDAPCSGSGAWARNPDAKWRLTPFRLAELAGLQDRLLAEAAAFVRPGGRLVYATCSLMPVENADRLDAFLAARGAFCEQIRRAWTPLDGGDGFFAAVLVRRAA